MRERLVGGIDPGGHDLGLVARHGHRLVKALTVTRDDEDRARWVELCAIATVGFFAELDVEAVGVEDVNPPSPHMGTIAVGGILDTAAVLGGLLVGMEGLHVIAPGGNGSAPLVAYPEALRPTSGKGRGRDRLRHVRSAWDVAGAVLFRLNTNPTTPRHLGVIR